MYKISFWKAAFERAVGAFCAPIAGGALASTLWDMDWKKVAGVAGAASVASLAASVAKATVGPEGPGLTETTAGAEPNR